METASGTAALAIPLPAREAFETSATPMSAAEADYLHVARLLFGQDLQLQVEPDPTLQVPVEYRFFPESGSMVIAHNAALCSPKREKVSRKKLRTLIKAMLPLADERWRWHREERRLQRFAADPRKHELMPMRPPGRTALDLLRQVNREPVILFCLHWLDYGGAEKFAIECIQWASRHYRCIVLTDRVSSNPLDRLVENPAVSVIHLPKLVPGAYWGELLETLLLTYDVKLLHIHHCMWLYENLMAVRRLSPKTKVIDSLHILERDAEGYPRVSGIWSHFIDARHVISHELRQYLARSFGQTDHVLLGRLVDKTAVARPQSNFAQLGDSRIRICFVGRMERQKRPALFVLFARALSAQMARHRPDIQLEFSMIGEGSLLELVKMTARVQAPELDIHFLRSDTNVPDHLSRNHLVFLPSANEGIPLIIYEAICSGCIPVATDVGGNREMCPEALLVPAEPSAAVDQAARVARQLIESPAHREAAWQKLAGRYRAAQEEPNGLEVCAALYQQAMAEAAP